MNIIIKQLIFAFLFIKIHIIYFFHLLVPVLLWLNLPNIFFKPIVLDKDFKILDTKDKDITYKFVSFLQYNSSKVSNVKKFLNQLYNDENNSKFIIIEFYKDENRKKEFLIDLEKINEYNDFDSSSVIFIKYGRIHI